MPARLYNFAIMAIDHSTRTKTFCLYLHIANDPEEAVGMGLRDIYAKHPHCQYQVGEVTEIAQTLIDDIKRLL